ncbi:hypothetical protein [Pseudidiomarina sp. CB1]|uniref:hypothetical protein n=1 Tax=Pseudidiomarina sp. CB1 TaxID=2972484 RepID=UPI00216151C1|nr:hypothetical protein [Pseudidiomarina sp. CB1]
MTIDHKNPPLWSTQQQQALAALKLTLWRSKGNDEQPAVAAESTAKTVNCYKAGPWLFVSAKPLAVDLPVWLRDLTRACSGSAERPAEVSPSAVAEWQQELVLQLAESLPSAADKKALWRHIAHREQ